MYNVSDSYLDAFKAPSRQITGSITCETDSGNLAIEPGGQLIKFTIEKTSPKGKLFGFAVSQKITIEALGVFETIKKGNRIIPRIESKDYNGEEVLLPYFYVDTIEINKVRNMTTIVGYDILHKLDSVSINTFAFTYPVYALNYALDILEPMGGYVEFDGVNQLITRSPNLTGKESARSVLAALAEYTGSICYVCDGDTVKFRGIGNEDFSDVLTPDDYFDLTIGEIITLTKIASGTELGDNLAVGSDGFSQVLWENPFLTLNDDAQRDLVGIYNKVGNTSNIGYTISWRGCPAFEMGDVLILQDKDGNANFVRYYAETLEYNGGLKAESEWEPGESENVEVSPPSISKVISQTYARVDKTAKTIDLVASEQEGLTEKVSQLELTTNQVSISVNEKLSAMEKKVDAVVTPENLSIIVSDTIKREGASFVQTETGFTFDSQGLNIHKTGSEINTTITENGMTVSSYDDPMLVANNQGVNAKNLHATTYLFIGKNSRFEDYADGTRTGCFWIGAVD